MAKPARGFDPASDFEESDLTTPPIAANDDVEMIAANMDQEKMKKSHEGVQDEGNKWQELMKKLEADQERSLGYDNSLGKGDLPSSIIMDDQKQPGAITEPPEVTTGEQQQKAATEVRQQQQKQMIQKAAKLSKGSPKLPELFSGPLGQAISNIPGVKSMATQIMKNKNPKDGLKKAERLKKILNGAKRGFGIAEGMTRWVEIFVPTLETIVVPILMILSLPIYILFCSIFPEAISKVAKEINEVVKRLETVSRLLKEQLAKQQQAKRIRAIMQQEKVAARGSTPPSNQTQKAAA